jgi:hypothetical protein
MSPGWVTVSCNFSSSSTVPRRFFQFNADFHFPPRRFTSAVNFIVDFLMPNLKRAQLIWRWTELHSHPDWSIGWDG